jgi:hypothetical protein
VLLTTTTDSIAAATLPADESFQTVRTAQFGEVLRGVSFTPGTGVGRHDDEDDRHEGHGDDHDRN